MPGWNRWDISDEGRFNHMIGPVRVRREDGRARCRMWPERRHTNLSDMVHGGVVMAFVDIALFAGADTLGVPGARGGLTLDCSVQFAGGAKPGAPMDAIVEILRETGRMAFIRGTVEQEGAPVAGFSAILRKAR